MNKQILVSALGAMLLASCADHFDQNFETVRPEKEAQYGYLEQYDALKEYIKDRPNFHLGIGTAVDEYNKKELVYALTNSNFNETVAGNAMKMASCVADDGSMNFDKVSEYVKNATDAGLSVYGHTLAWHAQQPNKYLKNLIKDKELPPDPNGNKYLEITCGEPGANKWDKQISYELPKALVKGQSYVMSVKVKASDGGAFAAWPIWEASDNKNQWGGSNDVQYLADYDLSGDYSTLTWEFTANFPIDKLQFAFGFVGGTISCDDFKLTKAGSDENLIENGDFAKESARGWKTTGCTIKVASAAADKEVELLVHERTYTDGPFPFFAMGCEPPVVNGAIHFVPTGDWSQFFVMSGDENTLSEGNYVVYLDMTSSKDASGLQLAMQNGWGNDADKKEIKNVSIKEGRHTYRYAMPNCAGGKYDIILQPQTADATLDVHSVKVFQVKNLNSIPLTDEEKKEVLTPALQNWIYGMMEATEGKVKAWDVVNEALSGEDKDGDGFYDLWSVTHGTVDPASDDAKNNFYWQDYLGDIDYVRTAVAAARKGFVDAGGNPEELKLFINDYNLEAAWDTDHKKLKSLIHWIEEWEKDGVTKIDGIGSQMHVTCSMDPAKQKENEEAYVNMLNLMVGSRKLVRISELDMGLEDMNGNLVNTTDMTEEQHKAMRAYYEFIVKKYLEIVPKDKQWGICQWCATDSPANSGWRAGLPVGLWDMDYYRKHTYGGFAAGLGAPEYWNNAK